MLDKVVPGSRINVKIVKHPASAAATKTLVRVLSKDATVVTENRRLRKIRKKNYREVPRGGRGYPMHVPKQRPVKGEVGETGTVAASADVLVDLKSVSRFVEVSKA